MSKETKCEWCRQHEHLLCTRKDCACPCDLPLQPEDTMPSYFPPPKCACGLPLADIKKTRPA